MYEISTELQLKEHLRYPGVNEDNIRMYLEEIDCIGMRVWTEF